MALVLGIETSCDETGVAVFDTDRGLLGHRLYSQVAMHADYGGVVPELAARDHVTRLTPLIADLCGELELELTRLDAIAYTAGPGLVGALLVGACTAQAMAMALGVPALPIHHMEGHLLAPLLEEDPPEFPFVALLVSGGHSMLVDVADVGRYQLLGDTLDDAAGEAFDKTATLLGLGYPGGPAVSRVAESGDPKAIRFPRPMTNRPGLDFSFSGLKTHVLTTWRASDQSDRTRANVAAGFQEAVADTLAIKCRRAMTQTGRKRLIVAGGVGANHRLRQVLKADGEKHGYQVFYPRLEFCTDNGAMIAFAGAIRVERAGKADGAVEVFPRWPLEKLTYRTGH